MQEAECLPEAAFTALTVDLTNDSELSVTCTSVKERVEVNAVWQLLWKTSYQAVSGTFKNESYRNRVDAKMSGRRGGSVRVN